MTKKPAKKAAPKKAPAKKKAPTKAPAAKKASAKKDPRANLPYIERVFRWFNPSPEKARGIAERYVLDWNPTAALAQYYSENTISSHGHIIIQHPRIQEEVRKLQEIMRERAIVNETYVIAGLYEVAEKCLGHKPVAKLDDSGNTVHQLTFNPAAATKALENIGRHFGMFKDITEVRDAVPVEDWVEDANREYEKRNGNARSH